MANLPYTSGNESKVLGILKMYSRMGAYPLDATSVFNTKQDLLDYISEKGSYAYPGQVVAVANGSVSDAEHTDDYSLYIIRSDKTIQEIGKNLTFSSDDDALAFIKENGESIRVGELITVADAANGYILYMVTADKTLQRVSFDQSDVADVTWANLKDKPTSLVADIDDAVTKKHNHTNKTQLDKITENESGNLVYGEEEIAKKADITWDNLADKPDSAADFGITDVYTKTEADNLFVEATEVATTAEAGKLLKLGDDAKLHADITGTAAKANEVAWANVTDKPTDIAGYGITNAYTKGEVDQTITNTVNTLNQNISNIEFANIKNKPTDIAGYGITDAYTKTEVDQAITDATDTINETISNVKFADINEKPTTAEGYGLTDVYTKTQSDELFVEATEVSTTAEANKLLKLDADAKIPASILKGTIAIENLPHGALERCIVVADDNARFALTTDSIQTGDTVKVADTGMMYFVVDDSQLNTTAGYEVYTAGSATNVDWGGVTGKPTDIAGYGITDAVNVSEVSTTAEANKLLKLNSDAKLPASITGDADTVDGMHASDFVAATDVVTTAEAGKLLKLNASAKLPADITGNAATATNVEWTGILNKPTSAADLGITDIISSSDVSTTAEPNKIVKTDSNGDLPVNITGNAATATNVEWTGILNAPTEFKPTAHADETDVYGAGSASHFGHVKLSDATNSTNGAATGFAATPAAVKAAYDLAAGKADEVHKHTSADITDAVSSVSISNAGKLIKVSETGDIDGNITGKASTADQVEWTGVINTPTDLAGYGITDAVNSSEVVDTAEAGKLLKLNASAKLPADITGNAATATNVEWTGVQNKPTTVAGYGITDAVNVSEIVETAAPNKVLKLNADSKLEADIIGNASSADKVEWTGVENHPTTVAGYGITDTYTKTEADDLFVEASEVVSVAEANKVLKLDANGHLPTDITGNAATADQVEWTGVQNKPTTVAGYGITDTYTKTEADDLFVEASEVVTTAAANKLLKLDAEAKLPADILKGIIPLANLPHGALERCVIVASDTARFALTTATVQTGDTVKVTSSGKMYFVVDDTKLNTEEGYEVYTASAATAVPWAGVTDKPTTVAGFGISDAYTKDETDALYLKVADVATTAGANKVLKLNGEGKLPADITGNAATASSVAWANITGKPTSLADLGVTDVYTKTEADELFVEASEVVTTATANKILTLNAEAKLPADITGEAGSVAWTNIKNGPTSTAADVDDAVTKKHNHTNKEQLDKFGASDAGKLVYDSKEIAYMSDLEVFMVASDSEPSNLTTGGLWLDTSGTV